MAIVIITDDNYRYRLNSRFVEHRCPYLIPFMFFNETTQQYTIHTSVSIDIIKEIFYALKYENINVKDWLQLGQIHKEANNWELDSIKRCVVQNFVAGINEENYIGVCELNTETGIPRDLLSAIAGWEKRGPTNVAEVLNNKWQRAKTFEDKRQIAYHECIVINNKLYVVGGFEGTQYFNTTRCYNSEIKEWSECYISACEINGTIIVAGGSDGTSRLRTAEISMGGKMYVAGGYTGEMVLQTVEMYKLEMIFVLKFRYELTKIRILFLHILINNIFELMYGLACAARTDFILIAGGYDGCRMGNYFYAIGDYNRTVTKTVVRFDGKKWERICDLSVSRSALRVVLLKAWPDPTKLLCNTNTNSETTQNWTYEIESSESQETSSSQITDASDNSN
ncbi:unnamed protein product [Brugia pahangi]|uniref:BACK domain-containing protein n=1 Tax=Brugia pahangi TaxID=6280 RepID=A0A0N4T337_BRUPA|nr:unnamed protein product [Brugia pahangi]